MKILTIEIVMDNAAFEDDAAGEVARVLRAMMEKPTFAQMLDEGEPDARLYDVNGNNCGRAYVEIGE